jgi:hypothetical protein
MNKSQLVRQWGNSKLNTPTVEGSDPILNQVWNKFKLYAESDEFIKNFRKYSEVPINKLKSFQFMAYRKGGFQLPHIHNVGPSTLTLMIYFSKGWKQGDPGGTYMASDVDESKIIFEPYNLDNSMALFLDSPYAAHGVRYITKNVERRAVQIILEEYSAKKGWSGYSPKTPSELRKRKTL